MKDVRTPTTEARQPVTQLESARHGVITDAMRRVAEREGLAVELIRDEIAQSSWNQPANVSRCWYVCSVPTVTSYRRIIGDSASRFQVDTSFQTGKIASILAGTGTPCAS
jgi:thiamine biosynthesis protein ThiC